MKKYKIMGVFAHPDDETFGPGATLAKMATEGHEIYIVTATRGQAGQTSGKVIEKELGFHREKEIRQAAEVLGIMEVKVLEFHDGSLNEQQLPLLKFFLEQEIQRVKPEVIITFDPSGISGHLDHIAVSKAVIQLFDEKRIATPKIYYFGLTKKMMTFLGREGGFDDKNLVKMNIEAFLEQKMTAMQKHVSQSKDWLRLLERYDYLKKSGNDFWKHDTFQLARTSLPNTKPEKTLLDGLNRLEGKKV